MKLAVDVRSKAVKRSSRFLRRNMHKISRGRENYSLAEESYALAHMMPESNRASKLNQHLLDLYSLPYHNAKAGRHSIISTAISEINEQKIRIEELEQRNQTLMNSFTRNMIQRHARVSSEEGALMQCTSDEVSVMIEETHIKDEANMEVTMKKVASNSTYMDLVAAILKFLRDMELEAVRVQCTNSDSTSQAIQVCIRTRTKKGEGQQTFEWKKLEEELKLVLTVS